MVVSDNNDELTQEDGRGGEEGTPCVKNVTITLFEVTLC